VAQGNFALPISFRDSKFQKSISPLLIFPNPPQINMLLKGQIFVVFLNLLPNSNLGSPSALYKVAVAGY
jgi:hypothetical protein